MRPEIREPLQGHWRKANAEGIRSASKGSQGLLSMESQWEVQERRHSSSPAPKRRRKAKGRLLRREDHFEASVRLGRDIGDRARITLIEIARTHRVILGILLCVRTTKQNQAAASATCAFLCTERPMVSRTNVRRGVVKRGCRQTQKRREISQR